jgi:hypothetical protein
MGFKELVDKTKKCTSREIVEAGSVVAIIGRCREDVDRDECIQGTDGKP